MSLPVHDPADCEIEPKVRFRIRGLARSFSRDSNGLEFSPEAKFTFDELVPILFAHDETLEIGKCMLFRVTRGLELFGWFSLDPADRLHQMILELIQAGKLKCLSVGCSLPGKHDAGRTKPRAWRAGNIMEVSVCELGADPEARIYEISQIEVINANN